MSIEESGASNSLAREASFWRHIYETQQAGILIQVNGIIQDLNETAIQMLGGQSASEFIGKPSIETLICPEYIDCILDRTRQLRNGRPSVPPIEIRVRQLNGAEVDVLISATSWIENGDTIIETMLIDIGSLKQRERLLQAISDLASMPVKEELFSDASLALSYVFSSMKKLYVEPHNCGFISFVYHENGFLEEACESFSNESPLLISSDPIDNMSLRWIIENSRTIAKCESCKERLYEMPIVGDQPWHILFVPVVLEDKLEGCAFWIFYAAIDPGKIEADEERRNGFILAALTTMRTFLMQRENIQKTSELSILNREALEIGKKTSLQEIADTALDILDKEKNWRPSVIRFKSRSGEVLETIAYRSQLPIGAEEVQQRMNLFNEMIYRPGLGMTGYVIESGKAIRCLDLPSDPHYVQTDLNIKYGIYAPISIEGSVEGAIGIESKDYVFKDSDLGLLQSISEIVGIAARSVRLIEVLRERLHWLEILHKINEQIGIETEPDKLYKTLVDSAIEATQAESAALLIYNPETDLLEKAAAKSWLDKVFEIPLKPDESISGGIFQSGKTRLSPEIREDPLLIPRNLPLIPAGCANIGVPVVYEDKVLGVFHLSIKAPLSFTKELVEFAEMFGSYSGIVIGRMQQIQALQEAEKQIKIAYDETLEGWARAIGYRDNETFQHTLRVTNIANIIGEALSLDDKTLENLRRGAILHDVGKIGIPDNILRKPRAFTKEEKVIMRTHPSFAYELLRPIAFLSEAIIVPYCHHERWDGKGYPQGLKGDEIPLLARIFSVADVYDAMTSDRPYRKARTHEEAIKYIRSQSGRHFDPHIVDVFLEIVDKIKD
ncbi:MAG TPA: GAF domain-containing protein [Rectinema sp.]|nr:GAF domain-containing protein [Rectinema sp.]